MKKQKRFEVKEVLGKLTNHQELSQTDIEGVIAAMANGEMSDVQIAGFLMALLMKGPTNNEVAYIAHSMRKAAIPVCPKVDGPLIDTCGTGGGQTTFNVSTANAIVSAAAGVYVAKHGSDSISSKCGSANVLRELGVNIELPTGKLEKLIEEVGIGFIYAPRFHPVMGRVFGPENELGIKTIFFTIIGPLISPADTKRHVLGVYKPELVDQVADVANRLGFEHALVVHGMDGLDEISLLGPTKIAEVKAGKIKTFQVEPEDFGMKRCVIRDISGGLPEYNARVIRDIFSGKERGPKRNIVVLNTAGSLLVADKVNTLQEGIRLAEETIDSGKATVKLEQLIRVSNML
ncbi:MAG: anthranilate phosphoribosyltransferase [Bacteroidetes bacterium]|nr:anthranilate phosphoribosyltransferase [Bacteroidota bacterium]MBU2460542.1 anthranilate phosphoribosyltransferase [Patescibacteria group bacterium]